MADVTSNLVAHYTFNNDANDSSGSANTHNLTTSGVVYIANKDSVAARAVEFDGVNDSAYASTHADFELPMGQDFSVSCWVYRPTAAASEVIQTWSATQYGWSVGFLANGTAKTQLSSTAGSWNVQAGTVGTGAWHHVVFTFDRTGVAKVYIDNVSSQMHANNSPSNVAITAVNPRVGIGHRDDDGGTTEYYDLKLDEVRYYRRELAAADVTDLYNGFDYEAAIVRRSNKIGGVDKKSVISASGVNPDSIKSINGVI